MPVFSIIVPVYNVERYLSVCLDSLRLQTFNDIEILCVIDGSRDRSINVAKEHAALDPRIRIIEKENGGLSSARNVGIEQAQGKYLLFVDSDDFLEKNACATVFKAFEENNADVVTFGANSIPSASEGSWTYETLSPRDVIYKGFKPALLFDEASHPFAWRTALSADFTKRHAIRFDEDLAFGEDQLFHFDIYPLAETTVLLSDKLYNYRLSRKDSLMHNLFSGDLDDRVSKHLKITKKIFDDWSERGLVGFYDEEFMLWALDFLADDIIRLPEPMRTPRAKEFGDLFMGVFDSPIEIAKSCPALSRQLVVAFVGLSEGSITAFPNALVFRYRIAQRSFKDLVKAVLGRVFKPRQRAATAEEVQRIVEVAQEQMCAEEQLAVSLQLLALETGQKRE